MMATVEDIYNSHHLPEYDPEDLETILRKFYTVKHLHKSYFLLNRDLLSKEDWL